MSRPLSFQQVILRLQEFWAERGCLIWQPYSEKVGAGTMNPATVLRAEEKCNQKHPVSRFPRCVRQGRS